MNVTFIHFTPVYSLLCLLIIVTVIKKTLQYMVNQYTKKQHWLKKNLSCIFKKLIIHVLHCIFNAGTLLITSINHIAKNNTTLIPTPIV